MKRRSFLISGISFAATLAIPKKIQATTIKDTKIQPKPIVDTIIKTINPSLSDSILSIYSQLTESSKLIDKNTANIKDEYTLAYSNSDALMQGYVAPITYASSLISRLPIEAVIKLVTPNISPKQISELTTISAFHGHTLIVITLRNFIAQEGREVLLDLLKENPKYNNDPRKIPKSMFFNELMGRKNKISKNFLNVISKGKDMIPISGSRGIVDLALFGASFPLAFSNIGMSRFLGTILRHGLSGRNMLAKDIKEGEPKKIAEQTVRTSTNLVTYPSNLAGNAIFQEGLKITNIIQNVSPDLQVQSNLRDLISTIFSFGLYQTAKIKMQQTMETKLRNNKDNTSFFIKALQSYVKPK